MVEWLKAYPAVFEETTDGGYSIFFPDISGCISAGENLEEAITMAKEALSLHLSEMINDNDEVPKIDLLNAKEEANGCLLMMIEPNPAIISRRTKEHAVRVNITIPQMLLERADRYAKAANINRSRLIAEALEHQILVAY
jgi:predicted RNase H-like HicB family nuclease